MNSLEQPKSKRTVKVFGIASFLNDMGSDMVFSVWPIFVTSVMGANMVVLGFLDGLGEAIVSISQAVSGYISDRIRKRKLFVWLGYSFGAISRIGYSLSPTWHFLVPFRMLDRSGKMRSVPRDAMISEISTGAERGKNFGLLRMMDNLGAVAGVLVAIFFLGILGYRNFLFLAAIPSVIAVILVALLVKEMKSDEARIFKGIKFKYFDKNLKLYTLLTALFSLGFFSYSFLLIFAKNYGFQASLVPVLYLLFTVVAAAFSLPFGKLSDRLGRKKVLYLSFLFWIAVSLFFIIFQSYWGIILAFIFYGLHLAAIDPVQRALVGELAPKELVGSAMGGFRMIIGLCALPSSLIAGLLWDKIDPTAPFYFSLLLTISAVFLLIFVKEKVKYNN
ncbi:MAG: MFS transporter [Candidatus Nealsonbacteria bacterium]|nr:MFS transporter [Candidatus Nealsonbacteria bacterium]